MALDNPVLPNGVPKIWLSSRWFELSVVVLLTVAVVAFAALWGRTSESESPSAVGQAEAVESGRTAVPAAAAVTPGAEQTAEVESAGTRSEAVSVAESTALLDAGASAQLAIPDQTGVVPGRPDPAAPALPGSFERYQVQRGESLFSIATTRGLSVAELVSWNWQLDVDSVLIRGEWLWIPLWGPTSVADEGVGSAEDGKSGRGGG
ncbi:MAG: LysM domain-containing protein [Chloroflexi bacterium]|nr:LysM domain-containing protein [Chloroflexota bacterium]MCY3695956.1 LysM domain-containing protein [Chloroflexota bacterium]